MADRYMYVPMIGLSLMLLWSVPDRWLGLTSQAFTVLGMAVSVLLVLSVRQVAVWRDSITLFEYAISVAPDNNFLSRSNLGIAYTEEERHDDAEKQFLLALELRPNDPDCVSNLARVFNKSGQHGRAIKLLNSAIAIHPQAPLLWLQSGNALRGLANPDSAIESYRMAVKLDANSSESLNNLGLMLCRSGDSAEFSEGLEFIRRAIEADPENAHAYNSLGNALVLAGKLDAAADSYRAAVRIGDLEGAKQNLKYVEEEILKLKQ